MDDFTEKLLELLKEQRKLEKPKTLGGWLKELANSGNLTAEMWDAEYKGLSMVRMDDEGLAFNFWGNRKFLLMIILANIGRFTDNDLNLIDPEKFTDEQIDKITALFEGAIPVIEKIFGASDDEEDKGGFKDLSQFVKYHAQKRKWSQSDLVRKTGLSNFSISRIFSGYYKNFYQGTYDKIAAAFGVKIPENIIRLKRRRIVRA